MMKLKFLLLLTVVLMLSACRSEAQKLNDAGNEAFVTGQYDVALEQYQRAGAEDPDLAVPDYNRANVYYRQTNFEDAGTALRTAMLRSDTTLTQHGQFNLGNALFNLGDYAGAAEAYKQALRLDPQDMDAKVNLELTLQLLAQQEQQEQEQDQQDQEQEDQQDQPQDQQEQQDDPQGGQSDQNQEENSDPSDSEQEQPSGEGEQQENQDQNDAQDGEQSQQPDQEQPGEEQDAGQGEQQDQEPGEQPEQGQPQEGEQPPEPPQPQQAGSSGADQQAKMLPGQGQPMQLQGLTEEQARQLLLAAAQDTETLQEYLQQIYVFPFSEVENDW